MDAKNIIENLTINKAVFENLLTGVTKDQYLFKPNAKSWCLLEAICHLVDEEVEDFRTRTRVTLETPGTTPPAIDPLGWVQERKYLEQNYQERLSTFLTERERSLDWLNSLKDPNWNSYYDHPKLGQLSSLLFLTNWLAHDFFHFRQITRLKYAFLKSTASVGLDYAGDW